jgi:hypothetical protein
VKVSTTSLFAFDLNRLTYEFFIGNSLNILSAVPTVAFDYSPLWNFELFAWTGYSIKNGIRTKLTGEFEALGMAAAGYLTNSSGGPLEDNKIINNCPIIYRFL